MKLVDSTFLIDLLRGEKGAVKKAEELDDEQFVFATEISVFELVLGIYSLKTADYSNLLKQIEDLFGRFNVLTLARISAIKAGQIAGELMRKGNRIDDNDCLIAGIALTNGCDTIVTRNKDHFARIKGIKVEVY